MGRIKGTINEEYKAHMEKRGGWFGLVATDNVLLLPVKIAGQNVCKLSKDTCLATGQVRVRNRKLVALASLARVGHSFRTLKNTPLSYCTTSKN